MDIPASAKLPWFPARGREVALLRLEDRPLEERAEYKRALRPLLIQPTATESGIQSADLADRWLCVQTQSTQASIQKYWSIFAQWEPFHPILWRYLDFDGEPYLPLAAAILLVQLEAVALQPTAMRGDELRATLRAIESAQSRAESARFWSGLYVLEATWKSADRRGLKQTDYPISPFVFNFPRGPLRLREPRTEEQLRRDRLRGTAALLMLSAPSASYRPVDPKSVEVAPAPKYEAALRRVATRKRRLRVGRTPYPDPAPVFLL